MNWCQKYYIYECTGTVLWMSPLKNSMHFKNASEARKMAKSSLSFVRVRDKETLEKWERTMNISISQHLTSMALAKSSLFLVRVRDKGTLEKLKMNRNISISYKYGPNLIISANCMILSMTEGNCQRKWMYKIFITCP